MRCVALVAFVTFSAAVHGQAEWVKRDVANQALWSTEYDITCSLQQDHTLIFGYYNRRGMLRTSIWDGVALREAASVQEPRQRTGHAIATPITTGRTLLYGGLGSGTVLGDTWEWSGQNWNRLTPQSSPPALTSHCMAECARGRILLCGGYTGSLQANLDTWQWDGVTWLKVTPPTLPTPRAAAAMAWNPVTQRIVLFAGFAIGTNQLLDDTWEYAGSDWVQMNPLRRPPGRAMHGLCFDWKRGTILLYGGSTSAFGGGLGDMWEWDGRNWTELFPANMPGKMELVALTHDARRDRSVMFCAPRGGKSEPELWELRRGCEVAGAGGKSRPPALNCFTEPLIGTTFELLAPSPTGAAIFFGSPGPCSASPQRIHGTFLCDPLGWIYPDPSTSTSWLLAGNPARLPLAIPPDPRLAGMHACFQALTAEPYGCVRLSNAISVVVMR